MRIGLNFNVCLSSMNDLMLFVYPATGSAVFVKQRGMITFKFMIYYDFEDTLGKDILFVMGCICNSPCLYGTY
jgi:hypothetical protein